MRGTVTARAACSSSPTCHYIDALPQLTSNGCLSGLLRGLFCSSFSNVCLFPSLSERRADYILHSPDALQRITRGAFHIWNNCANAEICGRWMAPFNGSMSNRILAENPSELRFFLLLLLCIKYFHFSSISHLNGWVAVSAATEGANFHHVTIEKWPALAARGRQFLINACKSCLWRPQKLLYKFLLNS